MIISYLSISHQNQSIKSTCFGFCHCFSTIDRLIFVFPVNLSSCYHCCSHHSALLHRYELRDTEAFCFAAIRWELSKQPDSMQVISAFHESANIVACCCFMFVQITWILLYTDFLYGQHRLIGIISVPVIATYYLLTGSFMIMAQQFQVPLVISNCYLDSYISLNSNFQSHMCICMEYCCFLRIFRHYQDAVTFAVFTVRTASCKKKDAGKPRIRSTKETNSRIAF